MTGQAGVTRLAAPLWVLAVVAVVFFLHEARELFIPIALAALISYALHPIVLWLERARVPRVLGAALVVTAIAAIVAWGAWALQDDFFDAVERLPRQIRELRQQWSAARDGGPTAGLSSAVGEVQQLAGSDVGGAPVRKPAEDENGLGVTLWEGSTGLLTLAGNVTVITFLVFFLLTSARGWRQRLVAVFGDTLSSRRTAAEVIDEITWQIQRFLLARAATAVVVGIATWLALLVMDAPAPAFWGVSAGVLNSIPYFGPVVVSAGLAVVGLFAGGLTMALKLAGVALVITGLEGWLVTPPLLGRAARMNTLAVFLGLLVWTWIWGVWGTLLAVPLLSLVKAVSDHVERLEPVSRLLRE